MNENDFLNIIRKIRTFKVYTYLGILNMLSAHWANFRKYFLFGYIWFGFCLFAASLGVMRFGRHLFIVFI